MKNGLGGGAFHISACQVRAAFPTLTVIAIALASSVVLTLSGCASSAGIAPTAQLSAPAAVGLETAATTPALGADWWTAFGDAKLGELVDRALAGNPNLKIAQARLARAEAAVGGAKAAEGLQVTGALDVTRQRYSGNSIYPPPLGGSVQTMGTAQVNASWELDFFGRNRAAIEAAVGSQRAAEA